MPGVIFILEDNPARLVEMNRVLDIELPHHARQIEDDCTRAIAWLTGQQKDDGDLEFGGWIWRYDLAQLGPASTEVTLTYDWSAVPRYIRERGIQFPPFGPEHLINSLRHLAELAAAPRQRATS